MRSLLLLLTAISLLSAQSYEEVYRYDSLRVRLISSSINRQFSLFRVNDYRLYSRDCNDTIASILPETAPIFERAQRQKVGGYLLYGTGTAAIVAGAILSGSVGINWPLYGGGLAGSVAGGVLLGSSYNTQISAYQKYDTHLRKSFNIPSLAGTFSGEDSTSNYLRYLSQTVRLNPKYTSGTYGSYIRSPWLMDNKSIILTNRSAEEAKAIALNKEFPGTAELFESSRKNRVAGNILTYTGAGLSSMGTVFLFYSLISYIVDGGSETGAFVTGAASMGAGVLCTAISIPISSKGHALFLDGLVDYDRNLRTKYGVSATFQ